MENTAEIYQKIIMIRGHERELAAQRKELENLVADRFIVPSDRQSKTFTDGNYKITIKKNTVYKLNQDEYLLLRKTIKPKDRPEKPIKYELDLKKYEILKEKIPELKKELANVVKFYENKPSISISGN